MAPLKCYSKCFCHKLVNLFNVFVRHWNPALLCLACHYDISCSMQTIRRCWTYFKSVCLDWQHTVGKTGLKWSTAVPGQALFPRSRCMFLAEFVSGGFFPPSLSYWHQVSVRWHGERYPHSQPWWAFWKVKCMGMASGWIPYFCIFWFYKVLS